MSPLELAPYARASLRSIRMTQLAVGLILAGLGLLVLGILAAVTISGAADPERDGILPISVITLVVAGLPAAVLFRMGLPHESRHVLVRVLEQHPEKVRTVGFSYRQDLSGHTRLANVLLTDGSSWDFEVPSEAMPAPGPRRAGAAGRAMPPFRGGLLPPEAPWTGLAGAGSIEVGDAALVLTGTRVRTRLSTVLAVSLGAVAGLLTILFLVLADLPWVDDPRLPAVLAILAACGGYFGGQALLVRALPLARVRLEVAWADVRDVRLAGALVEVQTVSPGFTGLSRFRTDRAEVLVSQCRS